MLVVHPISCHFISCFCNGTFSFMIFVLHYLLEFLWQASVQQTSLITVIVNEYFMLNLTNNYLIIFSSLSVFYGKFSNDFNRLFFLLWKNFFIEVSNFLYLKHHLDLETYTIIFASANLFIMQRSGAWVYII